MEYIKSFNEHSEYNEGGRGKSLNEDDFISTLKEKCTQWLDNPKPLARYKKEKGDKYSMLSPKSFNRKSLNRDNYVTMLMDNLPSWSKMPKRSESIIFYNDIHYNGGVFGDVLYFVIPFDNANFGKAPGGDLWDCVNKSIQSLALSKDLSEALFNIDAPVDYESFSNYMNTEFVTTDLNEKYLVFSILNRTKNGFEESDYDNFMEYFNNVMRPENWKDETDDTGYKSVSYNSLIDLKGGVSECWTDSNCLVFRAGKVDSDFDVLSAYNRFEEFIDLHI